MPSPTNNLTQICVSCTKKDRDTLKTYARASGKSVSAYLVEMGLSGVSGNPLSDLEDFEDLLKREAMGFSGVRYVPYAQGAPDRLSAMETARALAVGELKIVSAPGHPEQYLRGSGIYKIAKSGNYRTAELVMKVSPFAAFAMLNRFCTLSTLPEYSQGYLRASKTQEYLDMATEFRNKYGAVWTDTYIPVNTNTRAKGHLCCAVDIWGLVTGDVPRPFYT